MKKGMYLTFWLRTQNEYFNVKSDITKKSVFKNEIKTKFIQGQDGLISGLFSYYYILEIYSETSSKEAFYWQSEIDRLKLSFLRTDRNETISNSNFRFFHRMILDRQKNSLSEQNLDKNWKI